MLLLADIAILTVYEGSLSGVFNLELENPLSLINFHRHINQLSL
jgi:hypothetical protein